MENLETQNIINNNNIRKERVRESYGDRRKALKEVYRAGNGGEKERKLMI